MSNEVNRKRKTYSREFKLKAVLMKLEEGYSKPRIALELGITKAMLERWVKRYRQFGEAGLEEQRGRSSAGRPPKPTTREEDLLRRIRRLEMENAVLKKLQELTGGDAPKE